MRIPNVTSATLKFPDARNANMFKVLSPFVMVG
jgi:hypothetical protein